MIGKRAGYSIRRSGRSVLLFFFLSLFGVQGKGVRAQTATLSWQAVNEDTSGHAEVQPVYYNIYCDTVPAFTPSAATFLAATLKTSFTHSDARLSDPNRNLFYQVRAVDLWGNVSAVSDTVGETGYLLTRVRAFLQAPYDAAGDTMRTTLRQQGILPLASPYPMAPRSVTAMPAGIVDWVLLQLRDPETANIVGQESFLLHKSGYLTEMDGGNLDLGITGTPPGAYQIVLYHRNHVAVLSRTTFLLDETPPLLHDFSADSAFYEGRDAACELENGVWGLWSGDINQDHQVSDLDFSSWQSAAREGKTGYKPQDLNFDGLVTTRDYLLWYRTHRLGVNSYVP
jgi:hypothetical protein